MIDVRQICAKSDLSISVCRKELFRSEKFKGPPTQVAVHFQALGSGVAGSIIMVTQPTCCYAACSTTLPRSFFVAVVEYDEGAIWEYFLVVRR